MLARRTFGTEARRGASTVIGEEKKPSLYFVLRPSPKEPEAGEALIRFLEAELRNSKNVCIGAASGAKPTFDQSGNVRKVPAGAP
jgi:hypothetical protein